MRRLRPRQLPGRRRGRGAAQPEERDDEVLDLAEPDFTVVNLPTTLRMPKYKSAFRVTHRFARPLGEGSFGSLAEDFFGLDAGAQIGLEFRFGIVPGTQVGILPHQRQDDPVLRPVRRQAPVGVVPGEHRRVRSIDGTNNFKDSYSPAVGAVVSRTINKHAAVYVAPIWVNNTNDLPSELIDDNNTMMVGVGGALPHPRRHVFRRRMDAARQRVRPGRQHRQLRHREARRRPCVPAELLEFVRHDDGPGRAGWAEERQR